MDRHFTMRILNRCLLLPVVFLVGCAGLFQGALRPVEEEQGRMVLEALRQKEETIHTLRGLFQASVSGSGIPLSQNLQGMVSYVRPDVLHLKGFIRLGVPVMDFHREGNQYELYFPAEGKVVTGRVDEPEEGAQWDQTVMLSIRALDAVLGKISGLSSAGVRVWKNEDHYRIDMEAGQSSSVSARDNFTVRTWVDAKTLELTSIEYRRLFDDIVVSVECEDYREVRIKTSGDVSSVRLPFLVRATDHRHGGGSMTLHFQEFIVNAAKEPVGLMKNRLQNNLSAPYFATVLDHNLPNRPAKSSKSGLARPLFRSRSSKSQSLLVNLPIRLESNNGRTWSYQSV
jgi:hypothetical protein